MNKIKPLIIFFLILVGLSFLFFIIYIRIKRFYFTVSIIYPISNKYIIGWLIYLDLFCLYKLNTIYKLYFNRNIKENSWFDHKKIKLIEWLMLPLKTIYDHLLLKNSIYGLLVNFFKCIIIEFNLLHLDLLIVLLFIYLPVLLFFSCLCVELLYLNKLHITFKIMPLLLITPAFNIFIFL